MARTAADRTTRPVAPTFGITRAVAATRVAVAVVPVVDVEVDEDAVPDDERDERRSYQTSGTSDA